MAKMIANNKKAYRDYFLSDPLECGIELKGAEVKSVRAGRVNFKDTFARLDKGEVFVYNLHIDQYKQASYMNEDPDRPRRLLLHKRQIQKLYNSINIKKLTLIPTKVYINKRGLVKLELALGRGKKKYDKRETIKKRDIDRRLGRALRSRQKR
jgi:SsrA-binding protein